MRLAVSRECVKLDSVRLPVRTFGEVCNGNTHTGCWVTCWMVYLSGFDIGLDSGECNADERCEAIVPATSTPDI